MGRLSGALLVAVSFVLGGCSGLYGNDEFDRYVERIDAITPSAGDAKEVNARTHMETPWPAYVGDRRISANGARMTKAIERYRVPPVATPPTAITINSNAPPERSPNLPQ